MKHLAMLLFAIGAMIALPGVAQASGDADRARIAGTVDKLELLTVNVRGGRTQTVTLSADAQIMASRSVVSVFIDVN